MTVIMMMALGLVMALSTTTMDLFLMKVAGKTTRNTAVANIIFRTKSITFVTTVSTRRATGTGMGFTGTIVGLCVTMETGRTGRGMAMANGSIKIAS
jgi:hypothetical protein